MMTRFQWRRGGIRAIGWLSVAGLMLLLPFNRAGLWEPYELRNAELARLLSRQLFGATSVLGAGERAFQVSLARLGQGELPFTSAALGFKLFGAHDYAARLASVFWAMVAAISLWVLLGRIARGRAQVFGLLVLVSLPAFAWQSRMFLGDAATLAALSLATTGLSLALLEPGTAATRGAWLLVGGIGLACGQLCRGILIGVTVPLAAVGFSGISWALRSWGDDRESRRRLAISLVCLSAGVVSGWLGCSALYHLPAGPSRLLAANLSGPMLGGSFAEELTNVLHAFFPWSALLPAIVAIAVLPQAARDAEAKRRQTLGNTLLLVLVFSVGAQGLLATRNVAMPFPAAVAFAGLAALALVRSHLAHHDGKLAAAAMMGTAVLLVSDFENVAGKQLLMTGQSAAAIPSGFLVENRWWIRGALGVMLLAGVTVAVGARASRAAPFSRERLKEILEFLRRVQESHFLSGLVLLEATLGTTGLLVRAHERDWIVVPFFTATLPTFGPLLRYCWVLPPLIAVVVPAFYLLLLEWATWLFSSTNPASIGSNASPPAADASGTKGRPQSRLIPLELLGLAALASGLVLTLGHGPRLFAVLSPKPALVRYQKLATSGDEIGLLGVNPQGARYYLRTPPRTFDDIDAAMAWLAQRTGARRHLVFEASSLAEVNAAFRSHSQGQNVFIAGTAREQGAVLLASHPPIVTEPNYNPLTVILPSSAPKTSRRLDGEFGGLLEAVGWDLLDDAGQAKSRLSVGASYRLRVVFRVVEPPRAAWQLFVHFDGQGRRQTADHEAASGLYPTELWQAGDTVVDEVPIRIDAAWRPGPIRVYVGFFRKTVRLEVTRGTKDDNRLFAGVVELR